MGNESSTGKRGSASVGAFFHIDFLIPGFFTHTKLFLETSFPRMRLPREPDDQSQETNLTSQRHRTGTAFVFLWNGSLKIDRSLKVL